jgi:D-amino-acid dehydrogenase
VIRSLPRLLRDPLSPLAIRWRYLPQLAPWLVRFALASRARRVEAISVGLGQLMAHAVDAYRPLVGGTEAEAMLGRCGFLFLYRTEASLAGARFDLELRTRRGVDYQVLDASGIARVSPESAGKFRHGVYFSKARSTTDPRAFSRALSARFTAGGGQLRRAEVTGFATANHHVDTVLTSEGPIRTRAVVICAGPWSRKLARQLGVRVPLGVERGYGVDLPDAGIAPSCPLLLADFRISISSHRGGVRIVGLDELAAVSAPPRTELTQRIIDAARLAFPQLRTAGASTWMRQRPSMPDSLPVIGRAPARHNAYLAFGHGHKGLGTAAITGQLIQQLMDGQAPTIDLTPFRPTRFRFGDGGERRRL